MIPSLRTKSKSCPSLYGQFADLDGDRTQAVQLSGYQDFGWSIGVPTELFHDIDPGVHELTFELLDATRSSHPDRQTNFRLISIIST